MCMNLKFNTLVKLYQDQVYTLALYLVRDRCEAEDIAQEVYIKLWENMKIVELMRAKLWLMKVTRNLCLDRLRRRALESRLPVDPEDINEVTGPADSMMYEQRINRLKSAINNLGEPYRTLVIFRDIHQHSYRDIAHILELSMDQVKVYLYRARQQLKESLGEIEI